MRTSIVLFVVVLGFVACGNGPERRRVKEPAGATCPTTGERECKASEDCGSDALHCTGGRCYANQAGCPCSGPDDCGSAAHCTSGTCYANAAGNPCNETKDCGERAHCTAGNCYRNASGSPCKEANECGPGSSCVAGTCN